MKLQSLFDQTDFVHASGTKEELQVANYLKEQCEALGVPAKLEGFRVAMGEIEEAHLYADGMEISCKALTCCGSMWKSFRESWKVKMLWRLKIICNP